VNVRVSITVLAERGQVWAELTQIENHVLRSGMGARFECDTTFGPDRQACDGAWRPGRQCEGA
jgi:hypothetical protein